MEISAVCYNESIMTLLIKNVRIVGGAGSLRPRSDETSGSSKTSDIFVADDRISAIGNFPNKKAATIVDCQGAYASPGFIDVNAESDHYFTLFDHPSQDDFLKQGVTTIIGGMSGSSLAPLLYGSLESIKKWANNETVNVNWHTMAELLSAIDRRPFGVNFGTMAGHSTIRRAIIGDAIRNLTRNELGVFGGVLKKAMQEGAFGLSAGLGYVHARATPYAELRSLSNIVKDFHGIYAMRLRDSVPFTASVAEAIRLAKETGMPIIINNFAPVTRPNFSEKNSGGHAGITQEYAAALALIDGLPDSVDLYFDISPFPAALAPFYTFLPLWAQTGGWKAMLRNVQDEWLFPRMIKDMPPIDEDHFTIAQAPSNNFLVGRTLRDIREMYEVKDAREALLHLMAAMDIHGVALYGNIDEGLLMKAIASKRSLIVSGAPSFGGTAKIAQLRSKRTTETFLKFLSLAGHDGIMPLDEAIRKITRTPARKFGCAGRGEIKEGNFADIVCFRDGMIKYTIVNGKVAIANGEFQNVFAGKALRHGK